MAEMIDRGGQNAIWHPGIAYRQTLIFQPVIIFDEIDLASSATGSLQIERSGSLGSCYIQSISGYRINKQPESK